MLAVVHKRRYTNVLSSEWGERGICMAIGGRGIGDVPGDVPGLGIGDVPWVKCFHKRYTTMQLLDVCD